MILNVFNMLNNLILVSTCLEQFWIVIESFRTVSIGPPLNGLKGFQLF